MLYATRNLVNADYQDLQQWAAIMNLSGFTKTRQSGDKRAMIESILLCTMYIDTRDPP